MELKSFDQVKEMLRQHPAKSRVAVPAAADEHTLDAVVEAARDGLIVPVLIGDKAKILAILKRLTFDPTQAEIIDESDVTEAAKKAATLVRAKQATCVMKGHMQTGELLKVIVNKDYGIRASSAVMSLLTFVQSPYYHKLFGITDAGMLTYPTKEQKIAEIKNMVRAFHALGVDSPKVALLAAVETVNPKMPVTVESAEIKVMNQRGELPGCVVEGPISYDLALVAEAAQLKGYSSPVAGDADILVVPNIESGNILIKALSFTGGATTCGVIAGAKAPIIITSRTSPVKDKFTAIIMAAVIGAHAEED